MTVVARLGAVAAGSVSVYKILIVGCLIYELVKFRVSKSRTTNAAKQMSRHQTPVGTANRREF